jgi:ADP-ribosyl-[dinitrogen reductase] hydrolase
MRLAPAVLAAYPDFDEILFYAEDSTRTTHGSEKAIECSLLLADILASILDGYPKSELLALVDFQPNLLEVIGIASGEFLEKTRDQIKGSGYCVESLEAALWCFFKTENFDDAVLMAVNLGDDADTTAAITGQLAGAFYGFNGIRKSWRETIEMGNFIRELGEQFAENK